MYAHDGNHSAAEGAQLTALVLYATLSGKSPAVLPDMAFNDVSAAMQSQLRQAADEAVKAFPTGCTIEAHNFAVEQWKAAQR